MLLESAVQNEFFTAESQRSQRGAEPVLCLGVGIERYGKGTDSSVKWCDDEVLYFVNPFPDKEFSPTKSLATAEDRMIQGGRAQRRPLRAPFGGGLKVRSVMEMRRPFFGSWVATCIFFKTQTSSRALGLVEAELVARLAGDLLGRLKFWVRPVEEA